MSAAPRIRDQRRPLDIALSVFCGTFLAFAAISLLWAADMRAPRVTLLGSSEGELAVLVSAGDSRMLLATGDDPASLLTALERARHPTIRRLDLLVVGASERDLRGALPLLNDMGVRFVATIGPRPVSSLASALPASASAITTPTRFALTPDVTVDLDVLRQANNDAPAWRALIQAGQTRVLVVSSAVAATNIVLDQPVTALIVTAGRDPLPAWDRVRTPLLAFPEGAINCDDLRGAARDGAVPAWALRVFPAEAIRLGLGDAGLTFTEGSAQSLASPVSGERRGAPGGRRQTRRGRPPIARDRRGGQRR